MKSDLITQLNLRQFLTLLSCPEILWLCSKKNMKNLDPSPQIWASFMNDPWKYNGGDHLKISMPSYFNRHVLHKMTSKTVVIAMTFYNLNQFFCISKSRICSQINPQTSVEKKINFFYEIKHENFNPTIEKFFSIKNLEKLVLIKN